METHHESMKVYLTTTSRLGVIWHAVTSVSRRWIWWLRWVPHSNILTSWQSHWPKDPFFPTDNTLWILLHPFNIPTDRLLIWGLHKKGTRVWAIYKKYNRLRLLKGVHPWHSTADVHAKGTSISAFRKWYTHLRFPRGHTHLILLQMMHSLQTSANGTAIHAKGAPISVFRKVYPFEVYANGAPISDFRKVYPLIFLKFMHWGTHFRIPQSIPIWSLCKGYTPFRLP